MRLIPFALTPLISLSRPVPPRSPFHTSMASLMADQHGGGVRHHQSWSHLQQQRQEIHDFSRQGHHDQSTKGIYALKLCDYYVLLVLVYVIAIFTCVTLSHFARTYLRTRSLWRQPAWRRFRVRSAPAGCDQTEDRGTCPLRRQALRHLQDPAGLQRMRLQDPRKVGTHT